MNMVTVGIDFAKNVFVLHGIDQSGKAVFIKPKVVGGQLLEMALYAACGLLWLYRGSLRQFYADLRALCRSAGGR